MHVIQIIALILLVAEFVMAPINLWSGKTMPNFRQFTGLPPKIATQVFAPVKLLGALLLIVGIFVPIMGAIGAAILGVVSLTYLVRLSSPKRRDSSGIAAFTLTLACAIIVFLWKL